MGQCYITRRGTKTGGAVEQLGIYPVGNDGRPAGSVVVPNNVTNLDSQVFKDNQNILSIALPQELKTLDSYCFYNCQKLQEITLPNDITTISEHCFSNCTSIAKVDFSKKISTINSYAFGGCTNLSAINIPNEIDVLEIKGNAFFGCEKLDNETITKLASLVGGTIHPSAFSNLTGITEITTSYVFNNYFENCSNLIKVTILYPLTSGDFGEVVFKNCNNLKTVVLPDNATKINRNMFMNNLSLTTVNIPTSCTTIENGAFHNSGINSVALPSNLSSLGENAFRICNNLIEINIPASVKNIGNYCFWECKNLKNITVDDNAEITFGERVFVYDSTLSDESVFNILSHLSASGAGLFRSCQGLKNLSCSNLPLGTDMFRDCTELISVEIGRGDTGNNCFQGCIFLQTALLSEGVTTIGTAVFYGCSALKTVYLPSSITVATNNSLTSTSSSYYAFCNCTALEDVQLGQNWNMSLRLNVSDKITVDSMVAMFNSLKDLTGDTSKTLTLGSTNLAKLTDEQKAIAINKNWILE